MAYFVRQGFEPIEVDELLHEAGVSLPQKPKIHDDGIPDPRRRELQELVYPLIVFPSE